MAYFFGAIWVVCGKTAACLRPACSQWLENDRSPALWCEWMTGVVVEDAGDFRDEELREWGLILVGSSSWLSLLACETTVGALVCEGLACQVAIVGKHLSDRWQKGPQARGTPAACQVTLTSPHPEFQTAEPSSREKRQCPFCKVACSSDTALIGQCGAVGISLLYTARVPAPCQGCQRWCCNMR